MEDADHRMTVPRLHIHLHTQSLPIGPCKVDFIRKIRCTIASWRVQSPYCWYVTIMVDPQQYINSHVLYFQCMSSMCRLLEHDFQASSCMRTGRLIPLLTLPPTITSMMTPIHHPPLIQESSARFIPLIDPCSHDNYDYPYA